MDLGLDGKVAAITGGSEGIGKATAAVLCREGAHVAICSRRRDVLEAAAREIREGTRGEVLGVPADVAAPGQAEAFIARTAEHFGGLDILIANAGRAASGPFDNLTDSTWQADLDLKLFGTIRAVRAAIPHMRARGGGRIITVTHPGGKAPAPESAPSSVSRAAGIALTKVLSKEYARHGICVNTVCVGSIKSAQWSRRWQANPRGLSLDAFYDLEGQTAPLGRMGEAAEVADLIAFLVSARAAYITGTAVVIDGGVSTVI